MKEMTGKHLSHLLFLFIITCRPLAAEPEVFESPFNWENPDKLFLTEQEILFDESFTKLFGSRAFHFIGRLDDGTQYVMSVFNWAYGIFEGWGMSVLVVRPDGSTYISEQRIPESEVTVGEDRFDIQVGRSSFSGSDGKYRVRIEQEEFSCDLRIENLLPLWQPGNGYVLFPTDRNVFMRLGVNSPWALTSGYMILQGQRISARGQCYGDRSRHSFHITRMSSPTLAFRGFSLADTSLEQSWFISVLRYTTHRSYGSKDIPVMILARGGEWLFTTKSYSLILSDVRPGKRSDLPFPRRYELKAEENGYRLQGTFIVTRLYHLTDIFEKLPGMIRAVVCVFFKRPVIFRMVGYFQGQLIDPDGCTYSLSLPGQCEYAVVD